MKIFTRASLLATGLLLCAVPAWAQVQATGNSYLENPAFNLTGNVLRNYTGSVGSNFKVSGVPTGDTLTITSMGFYAGTNGEWTGAGTVVNSHTLSLWGPSASIGGNLGSENITNVTLAAGAAVDTNGFAWVTLNPSITLVSGSNYDLLTSLTSGSANDAYLQPVDSSNNTVMVLNGSPFTINEGAYSTSGYAYTGSTYLGPNMQYQVTGPVPYFPVQTLYAIPATISARDNYNGAVGCRFTVGPTNVVVSHLGYYSTNALNGGLASSHNVGLFAGPGATPTLLGQVDVPSGNTAYYTNGFYWVQLNPPLLLTSNTTYFVAAQAASGDGDYWGDSFTAYFNPAFIGGNGLTTNAPETAYGPGTTVWPPTQFGAFGSNTTYCVEGMSYLPVGPAIAGVQTTNFIISAGGTVSVQGFSSGQQPVTNQWWEVGSPNVLISTTTSPYAALTIPNASTANNGTYFMTSTNALGGSQTPNVTVTVTAFPVTITLEPTNESVFQNYETTFSLMATGSPPISFQWSTNGTPVSGATGTNLSFVATLANNGEVFSCQASNNISGTPYTATSTNATLTVIPNLALPQEFLHGYNTNLSQNSFNGMVGGQFTVGNSPVTVTHLGYYAPTSQYTDATDCSLTASHRVGIFNAAGTTLIGYVTIPAGTSPVVNGYIWAPLQPALVLSNNTQYLLAAEVSGTTDPWGNSYALPDLNPYFASSCDATYWGAAWPGGGVSGKYPGQMYSAPNMAILAPATPVAYILPTNVTVYAGGNATLTAYLVGQPPVTVQWYTNGVALPGQTNLTLTVNNLTLGDSSTNYYVVATNTIQHTGAASGTATITVLSDSPTFVQNIQPLSQTVFNDQFVQFSAVVEGVPPLSYQWYFDNSAITGATNSTLTLSDVSSNNDGTYYLIATNSYGSATSSSGSLAVEYPAAAGTYPTVVMGPNLLLYYPLNDFIGVDSTATNWGSLGFAYNGTYVGACSSVAGPPQVNFGASDNAVYFDGQSATVELPPLTNSAGAPDVTVSNITIAAWVNDEYPPQSANAAIFFQRSTYTFGLSVDPDTNGADQLVYTWNGTGYNNASHLDLPTNQWALAAMVISPTNSALYLQYGGSPQSKNFASINPSGTFAGNSYIGWDTAGSLRYWDGQIGDVMVFDQALSPTAINALYYGILPSITLTISPVVNSQLTVTWSGGTLLEATNVLGPWAAVPGAANGSYTTKASNNVEFYRVQQ